MSTILTYNSLVTQIQDYLERGVVSDTTVYDEIPTLINRAERVLGREIKTLLMCVPATSAFTVSSPVVDKPARWRETISINYGTGTGNNTRNFIFPRAYEFLRMVWPDDTVTGNPEYYAEYDQQHWLIAPTPATAMPFEVLYYANPEYLTAGNQTNWWTEFAPELLTSRVFAEVGLFLKDTETFGIWDAQYKELLAATNNEDQTKAVDRTSVRRSA